MADKIGDGGNKGSLVPSDKPKSHEEDVLYQARVRSFGIYLQSDPKTRELVDFEPKLYGKLVSLSTASKEKARSIFPLEFEQRFTPVRKRVDDLFQAFTGAKMGERYAYRIVLCRIDTDAKYTACLLLINEQTQFVYLHEMENISVVAIVAALKHMCRFVWVPSVLVASVFDLSPEDLASVAHGLNNELPCTGVLHTRQTDKIHSLKTEVPIMIQYVVLCAYC
jgi:hypothetical protein